MAFLRKANEEVAGAVVVVEVREWQTALALGTVLDDLCTWEWQIARALEPVLDKLGTWEPLAWK